MVKPARIPTHRGDVLILETTRMPARYGVSGVSVDGQQNFGGAYNTLFPCGLTEVLKQARALLVPGCRTYLVNVDTGEWSWY